MIKYLRNSIGLNGSAGERNILRFCLTRRTKFVEVFGFKNSIKKQLHRKHLDSLYINKILLNTPKFVDFTITERVF